MRKRLRLLLVGWLAVSLWSGALGRCVVVLLPEGESLWERSTWIRAHLSEGVGGWLLIRTRTRAFQPDEPRLPATVWSLAAGQRVYAPEGVEAIGEWVQDITLAEPLKTFLMGDADYKRLSEIGWRRRRIGNQVSEESEQVWVRLLGAPKFAFGIRVDETDLAQRLDSVPEKVQCLLIVLGDAGRAARYADFCTPEQAEQITLRAWRHTDLLLQKIQARLNPERDLLIVLVPYPTEARWRQGERLMPVWLWGKSVGKGWLVDTSIQPSAASPPPSALRRQPSAASPKALEPEASTPNTQHPTPGTLGLGQGISLLTTIWHFLGVPTEGKPGGFWRGDGQKVNIESLFQQKAEWQARAAVRLLGNLLAYVCIGLVLLNAWFLSPKLWDRGTRRQGDKALKPKPRNLKRSGAWLPVWGVALTVASLFPAALSQVNLWNAILMTLTVAGLLVWFARWLGSPLMGVGITGGFGVAILLFDALTGCRWSRDGLLGSVPLLGWRFYGIGNEYGAMGIGWALLFLGSWLQIEGLPFTGAALLGTLSLLYAWRAANVGATLTALGTATAYGTLLALRWKPAPEGTRGRRDETSHPLTPSPPHPLTTSLPRLLAFSALVLLILLTIWLLWQFTPHLQAFAQSGTDRLGIIERKLWANWGGMLFSYRTLLLLASLWSSLHLRRQMLIHRTFKPLEYAWLTGGLLALLLNDSGIGMAAYLAFLYWCWTAARYWQEIGEGMTNHQSGVNRQ